MIYLKSIEGLECCLMLLPRTSRKHILKADLPLFHGSLFFESLQEKRKRKRESGKAGEREREKKIAFFHQE